MINKYLQLLEICESWKLYNIQGFQFVITKVPKKRWLCFSREK